MSIAKELNLGNTKGANAIIDALIKAVEAKTQKIVELEHELAGLKKVNEFLRELVRRYEGDS